MFFRSSLEYLKLIHHLRSMGMTIDDVREYIRLTQKRDVTLLQRSTMIAKQEKVLRSQLQELQGQIKAIKQQKKHFKTLLISVKKIEAKSE